MKWVIRLLYLAVFIFSMVFIVTGQRRIGPVGLLIMLAGLAGILLLLYLYNRKFNKTSGQIKPYCRKNR